MKMVGPPLVILVNFLGVGALISALPLTVVDQLDYSELLMELLLASFSLAMFIGTPVLSRLSDRLLGASVLHWRRPAAARRARCSPLPWASSGHSVLPTTC